MIIYRQKNSISAMKISENIISLHLYFEKESLYFKIKNFHEIVFEINIQLIEVKKW